jgi:phosphate-selective porin
VSGRSALAYERSQKGRGCYATSLAYECHGRLGSLDAGGEPTVAAGKTVAEEILDILRANGQITETQYEVLLEKARSEQRALPAVAAAEEPETLRVYWRNGIHMDSADQRFRLKIGGRINNDWAWFDEDADFGDVENNTEFRRARLYVEGLIYERVKFKTQYDFIDGDDDQYNLTARLTGLPWYENEGERLLHVGLSYSHKFLSDDVYNISKDPEANLGPIVASTGDILSDGVDLLNPELALVLGPLSLQGEYSKAFVDGSSLDFEGFYVQASYFLTGEHRNYRRTEAAFSRVSPRADFDMKGGLGAWELALRYSELDLDDGGIVGGDVDDLTLGLNWYLNPNVRLMLNYVRSDDDNNGDLDVFQTRFELDF